MSTHSIRRSSLSMAQESRGLDDMVKTYDWISANYVKSLTMKLHKIFHPGHVSNIHLPIGMGPKSERYY